MLCSVEVYSQRVPTKLFCSVMMLLKFSMKFAAWVVWQVRRLSFFIIHENISVNGLEALNCRLLNILRVRWTATARASDVFHEVFLLKKLSMCPWLFKVYVLTIARRRLILAYERRQYCGMLTNKLSTSVKRSHLRWCIVVHWSRTENEVASV